MKELLVSTTMTLKEMDLLGKTDLFQFQLYQLFANVSRLVVACRRFFRFCRRTRSNEGISLTTSCSLSYAKSDRDEKFPGEIDTRILA